ncbi:MAG: DoxX family protein [Planctomycetota bacterium]|jgi:uncharacterized membrane protein YphA (DoxX/SURF4 family)
MSFTHSAARNFVPLLSRLVLAAAFIPSGWDKIMGEEREYAGEDARILQRLGIGEPVESEVALGRLSGFVLASYQDVETGSIIKRRQPAAAPNEQEETDEDPPGKVMTVEVVPEPPEEMPAVEVVLEPPPVSDEPGEADEGDADGTRVKAKRLHRITLMLVEGPWPEKLKPGWMAWAAAGCELVGGTLVLIGLFSRLWGLGLAITMAFAFYLTSAGPLGQYGLISLPVESIADFNRMFCQIGLFTLAFGVFLTGAGGLSLDRALFRTSDEEIEEEHLLNLG